MAVILVASPIPTPVGVADNQLQDFWEDAQGPGAPMTQSPALGTVEVSLCPTPCSALSKVGIGNRRSPPYRELCISGAQLLFSSCCPGPSWWSADSYVQPGTESQVADARRDCEEAGLTAQMCVN